MNVFALLFVAVISGLFLGGCASAPPQQEEDVYLANPASVLMKEKEDVEEQMGHEWKQRAFRELEISRNRIKEAAAMNAMKPEIEEAINSAQQSYNAADYVDAVKQANLAKKLAETSMNNVYLERSKGMLSELHGAKSNMSFEMQKLLANADSAFSSKQGKKSYDMANTLILQLRRVRGAAP